ncbi:hypothetical protein VTN77DRAFT_4083 [Rasamsonia byssochlamydoides]|uniref:uncharacterized protein n=1 Tax=Rasamsonia byssochlamydoides TaxID=89139 RepID=UPI003743F7E7
MKASYNVQPLIRFPELDNVRHLVDGLLRNEDESLKDIPYASVIEACGGPETVTATVLASIDPQIRALEGKTITVKLLDNIQTKQSNEENPWNSGYLDYIKDNRTLDPNTS